MKIYLNTLINGRGVENTLVATFAEEFKTEAVDAFLTLCAKYEAVCQYWDVGVENEQFSTRQYNIEHVTIEIVLRKN